MINEKTPIPVSLVIVLISSCVALAGWISALEVRSATHDEKITKIEQKYEDSSRYLYQILDRLSRIEGLLDRPRKEGK